MTVDTRSNHNPAAQPIEELAELAEFRYRLRGFLSFSESESERRGIQAQQYQLMQVIASLPDGQQASISYIADRMLLRHNSTVELVDRAEKAGLVERRNDPRDLRRSLVSLTRQGDDLLREMVREHVAELKRIGPAIIQSLEALIGTKST